MRMNNKYNKQPLSRCRRTVHNKLKVKLRYTVWQSFSPVNHSENQARSFPRVRLSLKDALQTWIASLQSLGWGVAFLGVQITDLENRCVAMHGRLDQKCC